MYQMFRMLFPLNNDTLILFLEKKTFFVREINMKKRLKPENTQKVPIVVPFRYTHVSGPYPATCVMLKILKYVKEGVLNTSKHVK